MDDPSVQQLVSRLKEIRLEASAIIAQIDRRLDDGSGEGGMQDEPMENTVLCSGDRIHIKNKLKKPADWNNSIKWVEERRATVTRVLEGQIHFVTDNGVRTWRAPNNVRRLRKDEE
jgi:hypothetical protein